MEKKRIVNCVIRCYFLFTVFFLRTLDILVNSKKKSVNYFMVWIDKRTLINHKTTLSIHKWVMKLQRGIDETVLRGSLRLFTFTCCYLDSGGRQVSKSLGSAWSHLVNHFVRQNERQNPICIQDKLSYLAAVSASCPLALVFLLLVYLLLLHSNSSTPFASSVSLFLFFFMPFLFFILLQTSLRYHIPLLSLYRLYRLYATGPDYIFIFISFI